MNRWHHTREPAPIDKQAVVRMNRDTLYSSVILDVSQGATLSMPDASGRYQTAMVVDEDHYIDHVFDTPGEHRLQASMFPTSHVAVAVRTLVDPADREDLAEVVALQDQLRIDAGSANAPSHPPWDTDSLDATRALLMKLAEGLTAFDGAFGSRSETDPILHLLGTAAGWGGLPTKQATYIEREPEPPGRPSCLEGAGRGAGPGLLVGECLQPGRVLRAERSRSILRQQRHRGPRPRRRRHDQPRRRRLAAQRDPASRRLELHDQALPARARDPR